MVRQSLEQSLQQKLSPQQIQLMKLIELSTLELEQKVKDEIETNPALDNDKLQNDSFEMTIMNLSLEKMTVFLKVSVILILINIFLMMKFLIINCMPITHLKMITVKAFLL